MIKAPASVTHGTGFNFTVTAQDPYGNTATGYLGTVMFSSTAGSNAVLPTIYPFVAGDNGVRTFSATLKVAGSFTITGTDAVTAATTGTSPTIKVT